MLPALFAVPPPCCNEGSGIALLFSDGFFSGWAAVPDDAFIAACCTAAAAAAFAAWSLI